MLSQNEVKQWHFGNKAGLNFLTNPPTPITTSSVNSTNLSLFATSSMADANGNLLFYTNGKNIWNSNNNIMANGTGLISGNTMQTNISLKKPGSSNLYYIFTTSHQIPSGLYYNVVDMNLASGLG